MIKFMFPFIETLKIENGEVQHLDLHLQRIQHTCIEYYGATIGAAITQKEGK